MVGMMTTPEVKKRLAEIKSTGTCTVACDSKAGTALATEIDSQVEVFRAIQKGPGQPWIVRHTDGHNVKWS